MSKKNELSVREELFCLYYIHLQNASKAAQRAGYQGDTKKKGKKLLEKAAIKRKIEEISNDKDFLSNVQTGYKKLAYGSVTDAIKFLINDEISEPDIEKMDFFNISEIKKQGSDALHIKFFNRMEALEKLQALESSKEQVGETFYKALFQSTEQGEEGDINN